MSVSSSGEELRIHGQSTACETIESGPPIHKYNLSRTVIGEKKTFNLHLLLWYIRKHVFDRHIHIFHTFSMAL